jgi:ATP-binding cassette, subfamily F, member 3
MANKALISIKEISHAYGDKILFDHASLIINEGAKIGVIGRNGAGKTTFFKAILGELIPDSLDIQISDSLRIGTIPQHDPYEHSETVLGFLERYTGEPDWRCSKVAASFGLKNRLDMTIGSLSGGYQMRVKLTSTLLADPTLLLLDEPTNYLDLQTQILLEDFLRSFRGAVLVITHDREFIKKTCTETLDVENGQLTYYPGELEDYFEYKEEQKTVITNRNKNIEEQQKHLQSFVDRFGAKASKAASAQSKAKQITKLDKQKITIDHPIANIRMQIPPVNERKGEQISISRASIGYGDKIILRDIRLSLDGGTKLAILGENGNGKSTLLKAISGTLPLIEGNLSLKGSPKIAYYAQHVYQSMNPAYSIIEYLKEITEANVTIQDIYRMMGNFLFKKTDESKLISVLSGGERARLYLAGMFLSRADIYLLDEPTNHLDFETVEAMASALARFNGTVIFVSHNRTFASIVANQILEVANGTATNYSGDYAYYVWQLEQKSHLTQSDPLEKEFDNYPKQDPKVISKRKYELSKKIKSIESRIAKLEGGDEKKIILESEWLELTTELEGL